MVVKILSRVFIIVKETNADLYDGIPWGTPNPTIQPLASAPYPAPTSAFYPAPVSSVFSFTVLNMATPISIINTPLGGIYSAVNIYPWIKIPFLKGINTYNT